MAVLLRRRREMRKARRLALVLAALDSAAARQSPSRRVTRVSFGRA